MLNISFFFFSTTHKPGRGRHTHTHRVGYREKSPWRLKMFWQKREMSSGNSSPVIKKTLFVIKAVKESKRKWKKTGWSSRQIKWNYKSGNFERKKTRCYIWCWNTAWNMDIRTPPPPQPDTHYIYCISYCMFWRMMGENYYSFMSPLLLTNYIGTSQFRNSFVKSHLSPFMKMGLEHFEWECSTKSTVNNEWLFYSV